MRRLTVLFLLLAFCAIARPEPAEAILYTTATCPASGAKLGDECQKKGDGKKYYYNGSAWVETIANQQTPRPKAYTEATLPADCTSLLCDGALVSVTDGPRGLRKCLTNTWIEVGPVLNPKDFGAKGDVIWDKTCSISAVSTSLTCTSAPFTSADVGKTVSIPKAGTGHTAPSALGVALNVDSATDQMTAGDHQYKFTLVFANGETLPSTATAAVTNDGTHTSNKITYAALCQGVRHCLQLAVYRNSVAAPGTYRFLTYLRSGEDYYDTVPDATLAAEVLAPTADASFVEHITTIAGYISPTTVTLTVAAVTASANQSFTKWGTDDTAALKLLDAQVRSGSSVIFPPGRYWQGASPSYRLDTETGDHNGSGDVVIQVKETVDTTVFTAGQVVCISTNGQPREGTGCYTISSVSGSRITITSGLTASSYEEDYVYLDTMVFDLGIGAAAKHFVSYYGTGVTLEWRPGTCGYIWRKTDADHPLVEGFSFVGQARFGGNACQQAVWATGDGAGAVTNGRMRDVYVQDATQLLYFGTGNDGWDLGPFSCYRVLACTQASSTNRQRQHHFSIIGDPLGSDDAIAIFDGADMDIGPGYIDKGLPSGKWWRAQYVGTGVDLGVNAGAVLSRVNVHDLGIKGAGGLSYGSGKAIDPRTVNPNKSSIVFQVDAAGLFNQINLSNIIADGGYDCLYAVAATDLIVNSSITGLTCSNMVATGIHLEGWLSPQLTRVKVDHHSQWIAGHGFRHGKMTNLQYYGIEVDGTGAVANSTGVFNGVPLSGHMANLQTFNHVGGTGFWMAGNNVVGPLSIDNIWSEGNSYGYEFQGSSATNGLFVRSLGGRNNATALFRDGVVPPTDLGETSGWMYRDLRLSGAVQSGTWNGTIIGSAYGGTGNGFTKFSGPTTSEKTYMLPDASTTILTHADNGLDATISVRKGNDSGPCNLTVAKGLITGHTC